MDSIMENMYAGRELNSLLFAPVCLKYRLTLTEVLVLLFLANNKNQDTARDIAEKLKITKSHISVSVRHLEERGFLRGGFEGNNHRTIHLHICGQAEDIVAEILAVQQRMQAIMFEGFSEEERAKLKIYFGRMAVNINGYLEHSGEKAPCREHGGRHGDYSILNMERMGQHD